MVGLLIVVCTLTFFHTLFPLSECSSVWYIAHLYCLVVQAGFYSDMVKCLLHMRRVAGSILTRGNDNWNFVNCYISNNVVTSTGSPIKIAQLT